MSQPRHRLTAAATLALLLAGAPALASAQTPAPTIKDPFEGANRASFGFTEGVDKVLIGPLARTYLKAPRPARRGVSNVLDNLNEPLNVVNHLLQLRIGKAATNVGRFGLNTTLGLGGLFDPATGAGLKPRPTDFGRTFARYGVGTGPYVYIPLYGPSNVRDAIGFASSIAFDPVGQIRFRGRGWTQATRITLLVLDRRSELDGELTQLRLNATDPYATLRSAYVQNRAATVSGQPLDVQALPSFDDQPPADAAPPQAPPQ